MNLYSQIENKLIDVILDYEVEAECKVAILDEERRRMETAIQEIVYIIEAASQRPFPGPDDKIDEAILERHAND